MNYARQQPERSQTPATPAGVLCCTGVLVDLADIDPRDLLDARQAAAMAGVKPVTIRQWVHKGRLTAVDLPGRGPKLYHRLDVARAERATRRNAPQRQFPAAA